MKRKPKKCRDCGNSRILKGRGRCGYCYDKYMAELRRAKTPSQIKRNGLKRRKRKDMSVEEKMIGDADLWYSRWRRISAASGSDGKVTCFTSGRRVHWKHIQLGHYRSRVNMCTRYSFFNTMPQCKHDNEVLGGNVKVFREKLLEKFGEEVVLAIEQAADKICPIDYQWLKGKTKEWKDEFYKIRKEKGL